MLSEKVFDFATKEHTAEFKRAVESCKRKNPDKDASYCFASITSAFKKANKPIFLAQANFDLGDTMYELVALAKWSAAYVDDLPDSAFAYIDADGKRHLPYKDKDGQVDLAHVRNVLVRLEQTHISADAKRKALRKLLTAARTAGMKATTEMAELDEEGILADYSSYRDFNDELSQDVVSQLTDQVSIELSGVALKWESLGHALRVTGELIKPGVYQGIDGKKCRWTDKVLKSHYKTLYGAPVKIFHKAEGIYRKLPTKAGEVVGHITHLAEYFGRIFYKAMVFPRKAQNLIRNGYVDPEGTKRSMKESLEAHVALGAADDSGVHDIKAWQGIGLAFTDKPAVKGRDDPEADPVALARNNKMTDGDNTGQDGGSGAPQTPPAPQSPPPADQTVTLSASDLQNMIKSAVGEATKDITEKNVELAKALDTLSNELKELSDVRNEARLAEINAMEESIKKHDPDFKPAMLYDPKKATLAERESKLDIYIRGINKGVDLKAKEKPPAVILAEEEMDEAQIDKDCIAIFGKPYKAMLANFHENADQGGST